MENENTSQNEQTCPKCGGPVVQADVLAGAGPLAVAKVRSALSLGITRGSPVSARVCAKCGYLELYATIPEVLR
jgi:predicted nucleic-acid-binding Zn-ribbon protein